MTLLAPGFRFDPTDEELISGYLVRKATDQTLPWNGILERDIYGENNAPWDVFGDIMDDHNSFYRHTKKDDGTKTTIYCFTTLVKVSSNSKSKRIARRAGCGTWDGQTVSKKIKSSSTGEVIGSTKMFQFQPDTTFGHWIMHEYSLDGVSLKNNNIINNDLVLCKITRVLKLKNNGSDHQPRSIPACIHQENCIVEKTIGIEDQILMQPSSSSNNKRSAEEFTEDHQLMKKQRSFDDLIDLDQLFAESENLNIGAMLQCVDEVPLPSPSFGQPDWICSPHQTVHP